MKKWRAIVALILDIGVLGLCIYALIGLADAGTQPVLYAMLASLPICGGIFGAFVALIGIIEDITLIAKRKPSRFVSVLKLMSAILLTVLIPIALGLINVQNYDYVVILFYFDLPVLAILSFIFANKPRLNVAWAFVAMLPTYIYIGVLVALNMANIFQGPYSFLVFDPNSPVPFVAWIAGIAVGAILLGILYILLHNIGSKEVPEIKEEPAAEEAPAAEPVPEAEAAEEAAPAEEAPVEEVPAKAEEEKPAEAKQPDAPRRRVYHITRQVGGTWQVKLAGGVKAIRVFQTQAEAIAFTKGLVESRGGSYRIHSVKGRIRK